MLQAEIVLKLLKNLFKIFAAHLYGEPQFTQNHFKHTIS